MDIKKSYWVGNDINGFIYVFDPAIQTGRNSPTVDLLDIKHLKKVRLDREEARQMLTRVDSDAARNYAIRIYERWKKEGNFTKRRSAYCFRCGSDLDEKTDRKCNRCGWMKCVCGACGCWWDG